MCGRYSLTMPPEAMRQLFGTSGALPNIPPRYNVAPTQSAPVVRPAREGGRELVLLRWGLVPSWSDGPDSGYRMINARAETVATKPAFRGAFRRRRCLVPADGFYEWRKEGGRKQPYRICLTEGEPFAFAGLWESWRGGDAAAEAIESFTIVVTGANALLAPIHDRMPVILAPADYGPWLDTDGTDSEAAQALLRPYPPERMEAYPVSPRVNNTRNDDARLVEPLEGRAAL